MQNTKLVKESMFFAWYPVRTDKGWKWLKTVNRIIDERPEYYLGLLPEITYKSI